jgi:hypothetical protein
VIRANACEHLHFSDMTNACLSVRKISKRRRAVSWCWNDCAACLRAGPVLSIGSISVPRVNCHDGSSEKSRSADPLAQDRSCPAAAVSAAVLGVVAIAALPTDLHWATTTGALPEWRRSPLSTATAHAVGSCGHFYFVHRGKWKCLQPRWRPALELSSLILLIFLS